jgi:signal transduction histidine kinase
MIAAPLPANELERISAIYEYDLLDTMNEKDYDDITHIAAEICSMPISLISIIDTNRQWFKSRIGFEPQESHRDIAFCAHAILNPHDIFIINDSKKDERFHDNPLVTGDPHIGFYAGVPLVNDNGNAVGTLCVIDNKPNKLNKEQIETLKALARQVVSYFEIRKKSFQLAKQKAEMELLNKDLKRFAYVVAHDLKSPYVSMSMSASYLKDVYADSLDNDGMKMLDMMEQTTKTAIEMVDGILKHTLNVNNTDLVKEKFTFESIFEELKRLLAIPAGFTFEAYNSQTEIYSTRSILLQILLNLCNNAVKYNDKVNGRILITVKDEHAHYLFTVEDNGPGISAENQARVFDLFTTLGVPDRYNKKGTGIGLSTVQRLVQKMNGSIKIDSEPGKGCIFAFTISK